MAAGTKGHVITSSIEHSSVRGICDELEKRGWEITRLPAYDEWNRAGRRRARGAAARHGFDFSDACQQ